MMVLCGSWSVKVEALQTMDPPPMNQQTGLSVCGLLVFFKTACGPSGPPKPPHHLPILITTATSGQATVFSFAKMATSFPLGPKGSHLELCKDGVDGFTYAKGNPQLSSLQKASWLPLCSSIYCTRSQDSIYSFRLCLHKLRSCSCRE